MKLDQFLLSISILLRWQEYQPQVTLFILVSFLSLEKVQFRKTKSVISSMVTVWYFLATFQSESPVILALWGSIFPNIPNMLIKTTGLSLKIALQCSTPKTFPPSSSNSSSSSYAAQLILSFPSSSFPGPSNSTKPTNK